MMRPAAAAQTILFRSAELSQPPNPVQQLEKPFPRRTPGADDRFAEAAEGTEDVHATVVEVMKSILSDWRKRSRCVGSGNAISGTWWTTVSVLILAEMGRGGNRKTITFDSGQKEKHYLISELGIKSSTLNEPISALGRIMPSLHHFAANLYFGQIFLNELERSTAYATS